MHKIVFLVTCPRATRSITILIRTNLRASNNENKHNNSTIKKCDTFNSQLYLAMQCLIPAPSTQRFNCSLIFEVCLMYFNIRKFIILIVFGEEYKF